MPRGTQRNSWTPAARLQVFDKDETLGYRYCVDEPDNIDRKKAEGWTVVNKVTGQTGEPADETNDTIGAKRHRELVLMTAPKSKLKERAEYFENINRRQEGAIYRQTKEKLVDLGAKPDGKVVID